MDMNKDKLPPMENYNGKAMDIAIDLVKQLITLASGVLALSATFLPNVKNLSVVGSVILLLAWLTLITSIICGIQSISNFIPDIKDNTQDWIEGKSQKYAKCCKILFILGIVLIIGFAIYGSLNKSQSLENPKQEIYYIQNNG
jgi:hypothetical protein